jgi:RNA polymerase sigma-70 factor (ECF subfamily)
MIESPRATGEGLGRHGAAIAAAYRSADADRWQVSHERFAAAVTAAIEKRFAAADAAPADVAAFVASLHAADLALACACHDGQPQAWDHFVLTYRPELHRAARAIAGDGGRELADSLYAELYGLPGPDGERRSLLRYYHGRSRLATWLRSVLAQRHVDAMRSARRLVSVDDDDGAGTREPVTLAAGVEPDEADRMRAAADALSDALARLDAPSRLRLAYYYVHGLTLAETGRLFGEHEATASRKLEKARTVLRGLIEMSLATRGLGAADVDSWGGVARQAWDAALAEALGVPAPGGDPQGRAQPPFKGKRTP